MESLAVLLADHRIGHTSLQCRRYITAQAGTSLFGMYRQALRELDARTWGVAEAALELEAAELALLEAEQVRDRLWGVPPSALELRRAELRRAELDVRRAGVLRARLARDLPDRCREWAEFYAQACELRERLGLAPGEQLDEARREALEHDMHAKQLIATARNRLLAGERPLDGSTMAAAAALSPSLVAYLQSAMHDPDAFGRAADELLAVPAPSPTPQLAQAEVVALALAYAERAALSQADDPARLEPAVP